MTALAVAASAGCWGSDDAANSPLRKHIVEPREPTPFELKIVDRAGFDAAVARLRGKVVLIDYWATWCVPCVKQLPHTIELARRHRDAGLAVVTLSMDDPADFDHVRAALLKDGAERATNLLSEFGSGSRSAEAFDLPNGALPHYKLYDRAGKLRRTFALDPSAEKQFTTDDVDAAVAELLAEGRR